MSIKSRETSSKVATDRIVKKEGKWGLKKYDEGWFRSIYEHAFAIYLKELGIKYKYEFSGERIEDMNNVKLHYIPDFYLPEYGVDIEIINHPRKKARNKIYYYQTQNKFRQLIVLDKRTLMDMFNSKFTLYDIFKNNNVKRRRGRY